VSATASSIAAPPGRARPAPPCRNCKWFRQGARVVCTRDDFGMVFDVQEAERIVRERPRQASSWAPRQLARYVSADDVARRHLAHVDNSKPGIVGVVRRRGRLRRFIVEGSHRAYNARLARAPFHFYQLTEEETARCRK
jgi:hypothetical protein